MKFDQTPFNTLSIKLNEHEVGLLNQLPGHRYSFSFTESYLNQQSPPILSLSFKSSNGETLPATRTFTQRLPPFFANILPEGHLRDYLAKAHHLKPEDEFRLLAALGEDLPGALTATPIDATHHPIIEKKAVSKSTQDNEPLRFSLAGIQLKFSAIEERTGGLTIPTDGMNGSWIVKLPSSRFSGVPQNEFTMLSLAKAIGIDVPAIKLIDIKTISGLPENIGTFLEPALAIQRFDRTKSGHRVHMEDFAQVFGLYPAQKYDKKSYGNLADVILSEIGESATHDFMRRVIFSIIIGNGDMHLKNWSLLYTDPRKPSLSPAYDFVSTTPYLPDDSLGLSFGQSRSLTEITTDQLRRFASVAGLSPAPLNQLLNDTIEQTLNAWHTLPEKAELPAELKKLISRQIETVAKSTLKK